MPKKKQRYVSLTHLEQIITLLALHRYALDTTVPRNLRIDATRHALKLLRHIDSTHSQMIAPDNPLRMTLKALAQNPKPRRSPNARTNTHPRNKRRHRQRRTWK